MTGDPITDSNTTLQMDHDSPWMEALEHYFSDFLELLVPKIHGEIDWQQAPVFRCQRSKPCARKPLWSEKQDPRDCRIRTNEFSGA